MVKGKHVNWRPVTHVSRAITNVERHYAQIEGESLAKFQGVWRLRRYLYRDKFQVANDHKPVRRPATLQQEEAGGHEGGEKLA